MQIGITCGAAAAGNLKNLINAAKTYEEKGFPTLWMIQAFDLDSINALSIVGQVTKNMELGTAVVPTFPRHPVTLAQQALTAAAAADGRFTLGIGLSHKMMIENMLGLSYAKPARHMREYLSVLAPLLKGERVNYEGDLYRVKAGVNIADAPTPVPLLLAALGPLMLKLAGRHCDGTITWLVGPNTLENHIVPSIHSAADEAGRGSPRIVAGLPILLTDDADATRASLVDKFKFYDAMPSYRAMLDREGVASAANVALLGDEQQLDTAIARLEGIGITDFRASIPDVDAESVARTVDYLASRL
ncbi:MAG: TIGR03564 family F420-dependent LLM class oxidoreductase [Pseudomonadales bacterium]|nr:TIGR03564 family F420-dependent LLM class oxidoreductase [Pseudomonadales bacterium]